MDRNDLALFGNFLQGAVASVWSLAAFVFIYVAFLGQQEELEQSRAQAAAQERTAAQQRFENSFFELLSLHHRLVEGTNIPSPADYSSIVGRRAFPTIWIELQTVYSHTTGGQLARIEYSYGELYNMYQFAIGHYFRNLYHIVRFVDGAAEESKTSYTKILRAQLSSFELQLLFYNGLSSYGRDILNR